MSHIDWSPDYEYETIKVYFNGKEYNMKDKKDREKLKQTRREEKHKTEMVKLMDKYGIPVVNQWVKKHPNTFVKLIYELYLEEERSIARRQVWAYIILGIALVLVVVSFFAPMFLISALVFLFVSSDMQTNLRIDRLEQRKWRDTVYNMYRSEEEAENETDES